MQAWFWFWMVAVAVSAVLFFGVAILVAIFGWRDLRDLYRDLDAKPPLTPDPSPRGGERGVF